MTTVYPVLGMTCQHCVNAVTAAVSEVPGVESVAVDLAANTVTVAGGDDSAVRAAIDDAGYEIPAGSDGQ